MERYTALSVHQKRKRRWRGEANFLYCRYADDFVVLCNGTRTEAEKMKEELSRFLSSHLYLKLSSEKTKITHLNDGFMFRIPSTTRPLTQPLVTDRTYPPLSDHTVSANARDRRSSLRYSLQRYLIYFLGGVRWWILFRLNCSNYKLVLRPGAPTADTSGNLFLMNSGVRRWKCGGV